MFLNEYEIDDMTRRFGVDSTPNLAAGAKVLQNLVSWTNQHSDGWPYWVKPRNAAAKLIELLASADRFDPVDCNEAALKKTYAPIKTFLTKQNVDHAEVFDPPPSAIEVVIESHVRLQEIRKVFEAQDAGEDIAESTMLARIRQSVYGPVLV